MEGQGSGNAALLALAKMNKESEMNFFNDLLASYDPICQKQKVYVD